MLRDLRRRRDGAAAQRVTGIELFFDLVFVFAVTQLSHSLLPQPTALGAWHTALLFGAVWWVWIDTAWVTNALMQVGRSLFTLWALRGRSPANFRNFQRITIWMSASAVFWLAGGVAGEGLRFALWAVALALDLGSAWLGFWVPGLGRSRTADWDVAGGHLAERCSGFVLIALGESITVTGAAFFEAAWSVPVVLAFVAAFVGTAAMWWIYFDTGAEHGSRRIEDSDDPGQLARLVYTYVHAVIVAAVILGAVADEMALAEPGLRAGGAFLAVVLAAPVLYLLGNILFKRVVMGRVPLSHVVGLGLLVLLSAVGAGMSLLWLNAATSLVLVVVAVWEMRSYRRVAAG